MQENTLPPEHQTVDGTFGLGSEFAVHSAHPSVTLVRVSARSARSPSPSPWLYYRYMRWVLRLDQDFYRFVNKIESGRDGHQSVPRTKVTLNVTPRGRSEVFSASTRSKKYSLFVIWHHRECDSPPSTSLFLTLPYTSFRFPLESLIAKRKQRGSLRKV